MWNQRLLGVVIRVRVLFALRANLKPSYFSILILLPDWIGQAVAKMNPSIAKAHTRKR